jgi:hypothetical protein
LTGGVSKFKSKRNGRKLASKGLFMWKESNKDNQVFNYVVYLLNFYFYLEMLLAYFFMQPNVCKILQNRKTSIQKNIKNKTEEVYIVYLFLICLLLFIYGYIYCLFTNFALYAMF